MRKQFLINLVYCLGILSATFMGQLIHDQIKESQNKKQRVAQLRLWALHACYAVQPTLPSDEQRKTFEEKVRRERDDPAKIEDLCLELNKDLQFRISIGDNNGNRERCLLYALRYTQIVGPLTWDGY